MQHKQHFPKKKGNGDDEISYVSVAGNWDTCQKITGRNPGRVNHIRVNNSGQ
jgi:hypothetical protein